MLDFYYCAMYNVQRQLILGVAARAAGRLQRRLWRQIGALRQAYRVRMHGRDTPQPDRGQAGVQDQVLRAAGGLQVQASNREERVQRYSEV